MIRIWHKKAPGIGRYRFSLTRRWRRRVAATLLRIAMHCLRAGAPVHCLTILRAATQIAPQEAVVQIWLALAAINSKKDFEAQVAISKLRANFNSLSTSSHFRLAELLMMLEQYSSAKEHLLQLATSKPDSKRVWHMLAANNAHSCEIDDAIACYRRKLALETETSGKIQTLYFMADAMSNAGCKDVESIYFEILELAPEAGFPYFGLVDCKRITTLDDPLIPKMRHLTSSATSDAISQMNVHFALGALYDRSGESEAAFAHWGTANAIAASLRPPPSIGELVNEVSDRIEVYSRQFISSLINYGIANSPLVCIVGMPRSGTTLLHQILAKCPGVYAAGERTDFVKLAEDMPKLLQSHEHYPYCCRMLKQRHICELSQAIYNRFMSIAGSHRKIITKLPHDYKELGLIKILFPHAKIIHCRRNVLDAGLSCFSGNFGSLSYTSDLTILAAAFEQCYRLMKHWEGVLPHSSILDVSYEELVTCPEVTIKRICEFAGIDFVPECMEFYNSNDTITSFSRWQVRQPIYRSSVNRSGSYRQFLGPLLAVEGRVTNG